MPEMKRILYMTCLAAVSFAVLFPASTLRAQGPGVAYPDLSPAETREVLGKRSGNPDFVLLDVRTRKEFDAERIAGAVLIDYNSPSFREEIARLDRERTYLVYCRTGNRSAGAIKVMRESGFRNVLHFAGGISKWKEAGFPTTR